MISSLTLGVLGVLGANPFRAREQTRAKDAKFKGIKQDEIARVRVEWAFALHKELGPGRVRNWMIKRQISNRLSNPLRPLRPLREPISGGGTDSRQGRKGRQVQRHQAG